MTLKCPTWYVMWLTLRKSLHLYFAEVDSRLYGDLVRTSSGRLTSIHDSCSVDAGDGRLELDAICLVFVINQLERHRNTLGISQGHLHFTCMTSANQQYFTCMTWANQQYFTCMTCANQQYFTCMTWANQQSIWTYNIGLQRSNEHDDSQTDLHC